MGGSNSSTAAFVDFGEAARGYPAWSLDETSRSRILVKMGKVRYLGASSMMTWEFSKALSLQKANGWARFARQTTRP